MRKPFYQPLNSHLKQPPLTAAKPAAPAAPDAADADPLAAGMAAVRGRIAARFADAGVELTDADVISVIAGISAAIAQAEEAAVAAVLHLRKQGVGK